MKKAFTLIELLIVIAVISILIGIALPRFKGMRDEGSVVKAKAELKTLQAAVESYYIHNNDTYPAVITGATLTDEEPQIIAQLPIDPFSGSDYKYVRGGTNDKFYIIYSVGPGGNGNAVIDVNDEVFETNGDSCIYVSNISQDTTP